jgi:hypothetical protein
MEDTGSKNYPNLFLGLNYPSINSLFKLPAMIERIVGKLCTT